MSNQRYKTTVWNNAFQQFKAKLTSFLHEQFSECDNRSYSDFDSDLFDLFTNVQRHMKIRYRRLNEI